MKLHRPRMSSYLKTSQVNRVQVLLLPLPLSFPIQVVIGRRQTPETLERAIPVAPFSLLFQGANYFVTNPGGIISLVADEIVEYVGRDIEAPTHA